MCDINDMVKIFVWNGYHQRKLPVLSYPTIREGLTLQSIEYKIETLRIKWMENLFTCKHLDFERKVVNMLIENNGNIKGIQLILYKKDLSRYIKNDFFQKAYSFWRKNDIKYEPITFNSIKNDWIYDHILLTGDDSRVFKPKFKNSKFNNLFSNTAKVTVSVSCIKIIFTIYC